MKKVLSAFALLFILAGFISGCKKQNEQPVLENSTWRLTREIWTFPNGNTEIYDKPNDLYGIFIWVFESNQQIKIRWRPYEFEESGTWSRTGNKMITNTQVTPNSNSMQRHYTIIELTDSFMKVENEDQQASSANGQASHVFYELAKQ